MSSALSAAISRHSVRAFQPGTLPTELKEELDVIVEKCSGTRSPFSSEVRLEAASGQFCSYENGCSEYVVGATEPGPHGAVDYGYCLEGVILWAAEHNLGSCWFAGTYLKSKAEAAIKAKAGKESVYAVTPIGFAKDPDSGLQTHNRLSWSQLFFERTFANPVAGKEALTTNSKAFADALESVRIAPTAENKQDVRVVLDSVDSPTCARFFVVFAYPQAYQFLDYIDVGIACRHLESVLVRDYELEGEWIVETNVDSGVLGEVKNGEYVVSWMLK